MAELESFACSGTESVEKLYGINKTPIKVAILIPISEAM